MSLVVKSDFGDGDLPSKGERTGGRRLLALGKPANNLEDDVM
jgi:hypothetical protein